MTETGVLAFHDEQAPLIERPDRGVDSVVDDIVWPHKFDLFGVRVSATTYDTVVELLIRAAKVYRPTTVDFTPVSVLVEAANNADFRDQLNTFDLVCPDGQPVRWCLNRFHSAGLDDRVCGTTTMLRLCEAAAEEGVSIYLYGSTPDTLDKLRARLIELYPGLHIAGMESPPFRPLKRHEMQATVRRIEASGAGLVFLGIGSPKQERFAIKHRDEIRAVQLCVGAAFDFIAGTKKRAPDWMQAVGTEWLYRLYSEPRRLCLRYLRSNSGFIWLVVRGVCGRKFQSSKEWAAL